MPQQQRSNRLHIHIHRLPILTFMIISMQCLYYRSPSVCAQPQQHQSHHASPNAIKRSSAEDDIIAEVKEIHGGAGPFVVAGYRIGKRALQEVAAQAGAFTLLVQHYCPAEVQWSCIVDGLQASTHTSLGKLNLERITADKAQMRSVITNRATGKQVIIRLSDTFLRRFLNTPMEYLEAKAKEALALPDEEIFTLEISAIKQ